MTIVLTASHWAVVLMLKLALLSGHHLRQGQTWIVGLRQGSRVDTLDIGTASAGGRDMTEQARLAYRRGVTEVTGEAAVEPSSARATATTWAGSLRR